MTNREYFNNLSDEDFVKEVIFGPSCQYCVREKAKSCSDEMCVPCITKWLKSEHKSKENN